MKSFVVLVSLFLGNAALGAPLPDAKKVATEGADLSFDELMAHVRRVTAGEEWKKAGWKDAVIDAALAKLIVQLSAATKRDDLKLPVRFADVQLANNAGAKAAPRPVVAAPAIRLANPGILINVANPALNGVLLVGKEFGNPTTVRNSIVIADGNFHGTIVEDSIILARGAVDISTARRNIIISGHYIHLNYANNLANKPGANIILSGGVLDAKTCSGAICMAPSLIQATTVDGSIFINSPNVKLTTDKGSTHINGAVIALAPRAHKNPIADKITITESVKADRLGKTKPFIVVDHGGGFETVLRPGSPITDRSGRPIAELDGWKLDFIGDAYVTFTNGTDTAGVVVGGTPTPKKKSAAVKR